MNKKNTQESQLNKTPNDQEIMKLRQKTWNLIDQGLADRTVLAGTSRVSNDALRDFIDKIENPRINTLFIKKLGNGIEKILRSNDQKL